MFCCKFRNKRPNGLYNRHQQFKTNLNELNQERDIIEILKVISTVQNKVNCIEQKLEHDYANLQHLSNSSQGNKSNQKANERTNDESGSRKSMRIEKKPLSGFDPLNSDQDHEESKILPERPYIPKDKKVDINDIKSDFNEKKRDGKKLIDNTQDELLAINIIRPQSAFNKVGQEKQDLT